MNQKLRNKTKRFLLSFYIIIQVSTIQTNDNPISTIQTNDNPNCPENFHCLTTAELIFLNQQLKITITHLKFTHQKIEHELQERKSRELERKARELAPDEAQNNHNPTEQEITDQERKERMVKQN